MGETQSEDLLTIGQVARASGVPASTIRYYERRGILPAPQRVGGQRRYEAEVVRHLTAIRIGKGAGFSLEDIGQMARFFENRAAPSAVWQRVAADKLAEIEVRIEKAEHMRDALGHGLECNCTSFEDCVLVENELPEIEGLGGDAT